MAYKTIATQWLLGKKNELNFSFVEYKWDHSLIGPIYDLEATIRHGHNQFSVGRGTDAIGDIALEKSAAEAIERWCCQVLNISTVGCAIHSTLDNAIDNAKKEILERHYFDRLSKEQTSVGIINSDFSNKIKFGIQNHYHNSTVDFHLISKSNSGYNVLCIISDKDVPVCLGISLERDLDVGLKKSALEALRNFIVFKSNFNKFIQLTENDPNYWCCDSKFILKLKSYLLDKVLTSSDVDAITLVKDPEIVVKHFKVSEILNQTDCPLYFAQSFLKGNA